MLVGYIRPYQDDLNCLHQKAVLKRMSCSYIVEESFSKDKKKKLLSAVDGLQSGDKLVVSHLFALADSLKQLNHLLQHLKQKDVYVHSVRENIDTSKKTEYSLDLIVKTLTDFQSDVIRDKTKKGLYKTKGEGNRLGRPKISDKSIQLALEMYHSKKYSVPEIIEKTDISKATLYRYLKNNKSPLN